MRICYGKSRNIQVNTILITILTARCVWLAEKAGADSVLQIIITARWRTYIEASAKMPRATKSGTLFAAYSDKKVCLWKSNGALYEREKYISKRNTATSDDGMVVLLKLA